MLLQKDASWELSGLVLRFRKRYSQAKPLSSDSQSKVNFHARTREHEVPDDCTNREDHFQPGTNESYYLVIPFCSARIRIC